MNGIKRVLWKRLIVQEREREREYVCVKKSQATGQIEIDFWGQQKLPPNIFI